MIMIKIMPSLYIMITIEEAIQLSTLNAENERTFGSC